MSASVTGEKLTVEKLKVKAVMQQVGASGAPMKMQPMKVKLKSS